MNAARYGLHSAFLSLAPLTLRISRAGPNFSQQHHAFVQVALGNVRVAAEYYKDRLRLFRGLASRRQHFEPVSIINSSSLRMSKYNQF